MPTSIFWLEVGGPFGPEGLLHRSSCEAAPRERSFEVGHFTASRHAVSAARDYVRSVATCPRCCPNRHWTAPRRTRGFVGDQTPGFMQDPWRGG